MLLGEFKADNTNLSEEEMLKVAKCLNEINTIQKTEFSKKEAYDYLHMSRASFDNKVREGKIPKGFFIKGPPYAKDHAKSIL